MKKETRGAHTRIEASKAYRVLESGPIVLVTTATAKGEANVMTMGFHMVVQHDPPLLAGVVGPWDHSFAALRKTKECVIAVPTVDLARTVVDVGNCSGAEVDKLVKFGLATMPAAEVGAPLLADCWANLECRVKDDALVKRYGLFVFEVVAIWVDRKRKEKRLLHHNGDGTFTVDGRVVNLRRRMVQWKYLQVPI